MAFICDCRTGFTWKTEATFYAHFSSKKHKAFEEASIQTRVNEMLDTLWAKNAAETLHTQLSTQIQKAPTYVPQHPPRKSMTPK
jgi:hypothetical protein